MRTSAADQVIADVRHTIVIARGRRGTGDVHALLRDAVLVFSGAVGQRFDGLPIPIPARKVHPGVDADRIVPEDFLDLTHALEEPAPVLGRAETEAGDGI